MSEYNFPTDEKMKELETEIVDSFKIFAYLETLILYDAHAHEVWHNLDGLTISLSSALSKAEELKEQLGYEHD